MLTCNEQNSKSGSKNRSWLTKSIFPIDQCIGSLGADIFQLTLRTGFVRSVFILFFSFKNSLIINKSIDLSNC